MPTNNSHRYSAHEQEIMKKMGLRVRQLREASSLSQEKLAELAHVHRTYISTIERGQQNISLTILIRLADVLGVSLATLFEDT
ncbi:helix-turn-helix domain-containing protein [Salidesulfovibrio brasiliensis]|uniref:helix-turn-helix domain-containing protein n=1 Tax=Salidesulfovibrio brasiliensis TaxID=221711 RepID=UPI001FDEAE3F|nr:helix-turn-helix transcriptional regulator [Salidesulfovibrio brasiliensis]